MNIKKAYIDHRIIIWFIMADICERLEGCAFVKAYGSDPSKEFAVGGFILSYCKGSKKDNCVRKMVSKSLGSGEKVPVNMMPTGMALTGTSSAEWSENVKKLAKEAIATVNQKRQDK